MVRANTSKFTIISLFSALLMASQVSNTAYAGNAEKFDGISIRLGAMNVKDETNISKYTVAGVDIETAYGYTILDGAETDTGFSAGFSYDHPVTENFLLGVSYDQIVGDIDGASSTFSHASEPDKMTSEITKLQTFALVPTYATSEKLAIYGKIGKAKVTHETLWASDQARGSDSETVNLLGIGVKYNYTENWYMDFSFEQYTGDDEVAYSTSDSGNLQASTSKVEGQIIGLRLGYRF